MRVPMRVPRGVAALVAVSCFLLTGCSVSLHSSQYTFLKGLPVKKGLLVQKEQPPEKNWRMVWRNEEYLGYAINFEGGTYFGNEDGLLVNFDGWQVIQLNLPGLGVNQVADIRYLSQPGGDRLLTYKDGRGQSLGVDRCGAWEKTINSGVPSQAPEVDWLQQCQSGDSTYHNAIEVNDQSQLVRLVFTVIPRTNPAVIEYFQ